MTKPPPCRYSSTGRRAVRRRVQARAQRLAVAAGQRQVLDPRQRRARQLQHLGADGVGRARLRPASSRAMGSRGRGGCVRAGRPWRASAGGGSRVSVGGRHRSRRAYSARSPPPRIDMTRILYITQIEIDDGAVRLLPAECERAAACSGPLIVTDAGVRAAGVLAHGRIGAWAPCPTRSSTARRPTPPRPACAPPPRSTGATAATA